MRAKPKPGAWRTRPALAAPAASAPLVCLWGAVLQWGDRCVRRCKGRAGWMASGLCQACKEALCLQGGDHILLLEEWGWAP